MADSKSDVCLLDSINKVGKGSVNKEIAAELQKHYNRHIARMKRQGFDEDHDAALDMAKKDYDEIKKIAQRNAAFNKNAFARGVEHVDKMVSQGLSEEKAIESYQTAINSPAEGVRNSCDLAQSEEVSTALGAITNDIKEAGLEQICKSGAIDKEVYKYAYDHDKGMDTSGYDENVRKMFSIVRKYTEYTRKALNNSGAWIKKLDGYVVPQTHDMLKLRQAARILNNGKKPLSLLGYTARTILSGGFHGSDAENYAAWKAFVFPLTNIQKIMDEQGFSTMEEFEKFAQSFYESIASGVHLTNPGSDSAAEIPKGVAAGYSNVAKKLSSERLWHFKDGESAFKYKEKFGTDNNLIEGLFSHVERGMNQKALMDFFGPNARMNFEKLVDHYQLQAEKKGMARRVEFSNYAKGRLNHVFNEIDGSTKIPGNVMAAMWNQGVRSYTDLAKLGAVAITSLPDLATMSSDLRYSGNSYFGAMAKTIDTVSKMRSSPKKTKLLQQLSVFTDGTRNSVCSKFVPEDFTSGKTNKISRFFFWAGGLTFWDNGLKSGHAFRISKDLAQQADRTWEQLHQDSKRVLRQYSINSKQWEAIRHHAVDDSSGEAFFLPEGARKIGSDVLRSHLEDAGRENINDELIESYRTGIEKNFRRYVLDRVNHASIVPNAGDRAFFHRSTNPGTIAGEALRYVSQYKTFIKAYSRAGIGRQIYGQEDNKSTIIGLASLIAESTALGFFSLNMHLMMKGEKPRSLLDDPGSVIAASMLQGGGLPILGDFLFGQTVNRFGGGALDTLLGPVFGSASSLVSAASSGFGGMSSYFDNQGKPGHPVAAELIRQTLNNTPLINLFYTRAVIDYFVTDRLQEWASPGYIERMKQRAKQYDDTEYFPWALPK